MKVSIVIPVYNEMPTLAEMLRRVLAAPLPRGCAREVIVVDDGSTDGSQGVLREFAGESGVIAHYQAANEGKGTALRVGIGKSTGDIILVQDGDLEYDPTDYMALLSPIVEGQADVMYGSRFRRGPVRGMKWPNWICNKILTFSANTLFAARITDEATAYKAFRSEILRGLVLHCRRFEFCPEVTAKVRRLGYRIQEVPIRYAPRSVDEGKKIRYRDGFEAIWTLVRYRMALRRSFVAGSRADIRLPHSVSAALHRR